MTRKRANELLPIITAFANGKDIEGRERGTFGNFTAISDPQWQDGTEYRIRPEPREFWIDITASGLRVIAIDGCEIPNRRIHVREITE